MRSMTSFVGVLALLVLVGYILGINALSGVKNIQARVNTVSATLAR